MSGGATRNGPALVCVRCRVPPDGAQLDADARCPACGTEYPWLTDSVPVVVAAALEDEVRRRDAPGVLPPAGRLAGWLATFVPGTDPFAQLARAGASMSAVGGGDDFTARLLDALLPGPAVLAPGRAIDLGCGVGGLSLALARRGWDVTGLDLDGHALRWAERVRSAPDGVVDLVARRDAGSFVVRVVPVARPSAPVRFVAGNLLDPPFAPAAFSLVALVNVLDVVAHPAVALQQAAALIAPGGHLLFAAPDAWVAPAVPRARWLATDDAAWDRVFERAGLETVRRVDDLEWSLIDTPRMRHVYRVHGRLLRRGAKGEVP